MKLDRRYILAGCVLAASAIASCSDSTPGAATAEQQTTTSPSSSDGGTSADPTACKTFAICSDGQALAIALAANQGEIDEATAVLERLRNSELRSFAQQMINDHTKLRDQIAAAAANPPSDSMGIGTIPNGTNGNGTTPVSPIVAQQNAISRKLQTESRKTIAELTALPEGEVDQSYLEHQVLAHLTTIALMEQVVVPSISNPNLAMVVAGGDPIIKLHERRALQIQARLQGACGGTIAPVTPTDAGNGTTDAGNGTTDAGNGTTDAGNGTTDAGNGTTDAGSLDSGED